MAKMKLDTELDTRAGPGLAPNRVAPIEEMTFEEYLGWLDRQESAFAEWVDGRVVLVEMPSYRHQDLVSFLLTVLRLFASSFDLGVVLGAPFPVRLQPNRVRRRGSGREPDILFVARDHLDRIRDNYLDGPADLAVEIVSPSGRHRDGVEKYAEYEAAGVREYWMIDPDRQRPEFHRLDARGRYQLVPLEDGGIFRSEVVRGFWLRVDWLWQDPLPEIEALRALAVLPSAREG